jgi:hypothetical protein
MRPDVPYYRMGHMEPIDYIKANHLGFCEGNIVKYITRYKHKADPKEDLLKARDYIDFLLEDYDEETAN